LEVRGPNSKIRFVAPLTASWCSRDNGYGDGAGGGGAGDFGPQVECDGTEILDVSSPTQNEFFQREYNAGVASLDDMSSRMQNMRMRGTNELVFPPEPSTRCQKKERAAREANTHGFVVNGYELKERLLEIQKEQGKQPIHPRRAFWRTMPIAELRRRVGGDTTDKSQDDLAKELVEVEKIAGFPYGFVDGGYVDPSYSANIRVRLRFGTRGKVHKLAAVGSHTFVELIEGCREVHGVTTHRKNIYVQASMTKGEEMDVNVKDCAGTVVPSDYDAISGGKPVIWMVVRSLQ